MSSRRLVRVSESIRGVLARLVSRERTLEGTLLTITGVDVSPDLRHASKPAMFLNAVCVRPNIITGFVC